MFASVESRISLRLGSATSSEAIKWSSFMLKSGNDLNVTLFPLEFTATPMLDVRNDFGREKEECIIDREIKTTQIPNHVALDR